MLRANSNWFVGRLRVGSLLTLVLAVGACDPDIGDWFDNHIPGHGGSGGSTTPPSGTGGVGGGDGTPTNPCAAILCVEGTRCEVQEVQCVRAPCPPIATCVKVPPSPPEQCGPVCLIFCEHGNVVDANGCPTCRCNPPPATGALCPVEKCTTAGPKSVNYLCPDGKTTAGPACVVTPKGVCDWTVIACPAN